jgi:hypothetical protein
LDQIKALGPCFFGINRSTRCKKAKYLPRIAQFFPWGSMAMAGVSDPLGF